MSDLDELTDREIWAMPLTLWNFERKLPLLAEACEYLLPKIQRLERRIERLSRRLCKAIEELEARDNG